MDSPLRKRKHVPLNFFMQKHKIEVSVTERTTLSSENLSKIIILLLYPHSHRAAKALSRAAAVCQIYSC